MFCHLLLTTVTTKTSIRLQWVDNFSKHYATNSLYLGRAVFNSMAWTAHGYKKFDFDVSLRWVYGSDGKSIPAFPSLQFLFDEKNHTVLCESLLSLPLFVYDTSQSVVRDVRCVPMKPIGMDEKEAEHLASSSDGLRYFQPVDIYPENIASTSGLISVLQRLQTMEGFGLSAHARAGCYSLLHVESSGS